MDKSLAGREKPGFRKLALAAEAGKKGDYSSAVKVLNKLISETEAPPEAWLLLGRSLHALKDYSRALAAFNDYIRQRPEAGEGYLFAGRSYLTLGMPYKAVPLLRKALENNPGDSRTKALLGISYLKSKHSQAAVEILEEAVKAAPSDKRIYRAYLNSLLVRGVRLCGIEDYEMALQMLRFVLENGADAGISDGPFLRLYLGRAARECGLLEEALEHFTVALKLSGSDDRRIRWSKASLLMALGKIAEARNEIEKIRSHDDGIPELPWNSEMVDLFMIRSFLSDGRWKEAAEACRHWLRFREGSDKPMIHALYAEALRNLHDYKAAHNHLLRALEISPDEKEFYYADILVAWEGKDYSSLRKALKAAKSLDGDPDIIKRFTILCQARTAGNEADNITMLQNAIRSLGPEPELMYTLAEAYLKAGLIEEALSWFKKTRILKKNHESAWLGEIAALEALMDQAPTGLALQDKAYQGKAYQGKAFQGHGSTQGSNKNTEDLCALYRAYLEQWPDNTDIRREWALYLVKIFEYEEGARELEKLLAWEPSNPSLRRVIAYAYRKTGRYREAAVFLKSLLRQKPRDVGLLIEYAGCLERAGAAGYALAVLEKARELFQNTTWKSRKNDIITAEKITGEESGICLALGIISYRQKGVERAFDYLREAAALAPRDPRPYEWMAMIAKENGDPGDGRYYEKEAEKRKKPPN